VSALLQRGNTAAAVGKHLQETFLNSSESLERLKNMAQMKAIGITFKQSRSLHERKEMEQTTTS